MEFVSEGCRALLGVAPADLTGGGIVYGRLVHPDDYERVWRACDAKVAAHLPSECEYRVHHADGSWRSVLQRSQGIYSPSGEVVAVEGFIVDVTERLKIEQQLREAQRMDAIGRLTGGPAHDPNNYLAVIMGNLDMLADRTHVDPEVPKLIDGAIGGAVRGAELTRSLLAFSRRQPLDPKLTDAGHRIGEVVKLLKRAIGERIAIEFEAAPGLWQVEIDGAQLDSCIVNLANNARDAMPDGGKLRIAVCNVATGGDDGPVGDHVLIQLADNGSGMSSETMEQAFEPFFTTKGPSHGTGLGLSMVHGFVHQSGGVIRMTSTIGGGTTVRIFLPRVVGAVVASVGRPKGPPPAVGSESILLVEDNEHVRATVIGQLTSLGYSVVEAESGDAAVILLERNGAGIDLVITDIVMPGRIDGYALARLVLQRWPNKKVLLMSGFSATAEELEEQARGCHAAQALPQSRAGARRTRCAGGLAPLEIDAFVDRQSQQVAAQAIEPEFGRADAHPVAAAQHPRLPRNRAEHIGDADADRAAEIRPVGAVVELDQHGERVTGAARRPQVGGRSRRSLGRDAGRQIARDHAALEHRLGSGQRCDPGGDVAARVGLRHCKRMSAFAQPGENHTLERLLVLGDDEIAETAAHFGLDRREPRHQVGLGGAARGEFGLELRVVRLETELDVGALLQRLDASQHLVGARFADAEGVEALELGHALDAAELEKARDHLLVEHASHLARHAGREQEARLADGDGEAAGRADGIVNELGIGRQHRLFLVVGRHDAPAPGVGLRHARHPVVAQHQFDAGGLGRHLLREIVDRGTQPAIDDDGVGALPRLAKGRQQAFAVVADGGAPMDAEADIGQAAGHVAVIGVDGLAGEDLVAGTEDFNAHERQYPGKRPPPQCRA